MAAIGNAAKAVAGRRARAGPLRLALLAALALAAGRCFSATGGMSRRQAKSQLHTRGNLKPQVLEIPLEEEPEAPAEREPLPEKRIPYTLHMVTQFPHHKHLSEEGPARRYLEQKLTGAAAHTEDMIKHVELQLRVEEHFHKEKEGHKKAVEAPRAVETADGEIVEGISDSFGKTGGKVLAPYQIKVVVSMKSGKELIYSNPEKHAEHTLTEAADGMADGLRRLLREEKEKEISARRHSKGLRELLLSTDGGLDDDEPVTDTIGEAEDAAMEELYESIEAADEEEK